MQVPQLDAISSSSVCRVLVISRAAYQVRVYNVLATTCARYRERLPNTLSTQATSWGRVSLMDSAPVSSSDLGKDLPYCLSQRLGGASEGG